MRKSFGSFWRALAAGAGALGLAAAHISAATFTVSNTSDSGPGSLRRAILDANATPGADTITFDIPGTGVRTISPLSPLPALMDDAGVTIDGYTQPGSSPNTLTIGYDAIVLIELDGASAEANNFGILIRSSHNLVRGLAISGFGVFWFGGSAISIETGSDNTVAGCFLGTDASGTSAKPNRFGVLVEIGIFPSGPIRTTIGGSSPTERNVISGNFSIGIVISFGTAETRVTGNYIGTNASGTAALGNGAGIAALASEQLLIGGPTAGSGNLISGNTGSGIFLQVIDGAVQGNLIGTDAVGLAALPNGTGVQVVIGAAGILIGGATAGSANVISGNLLHGVRIYRPLGTNVTGNLIGTDLTGEGPLGNREDGVLIQNPASEDTVGATVAANVVAFNGAAGVAVGIDPGDPSPSNRISGNSLHDNRGLGIDLGSDGVTVNESCDEDIGPNGLQSFPVLMSAASSGVATTVRGTLNSSPASSFRLEFFANSSCDPSGHGEGERFLGSAQVTTDASCNASFDVTLPVGLAPGAFITATATDAAGNTSEFSACRPASEGPALTALSPARVWMGLKNSDDVGLRFDIKAEVFRNGSLIGSGEVDGASGGGSGFNRAILDQVPLTLFAPVVLSPGDTLSIRLSVRAGATGHRSGTARLWFNDAAADSRFDGTLDGASVGFHLLDGFALGMSPGPGPKRTIDVFVDQAAGGNPFKPLGTWSKTF